MLFLLTRCWANFARLFSEYTDFCADTDGVFTAGGPEPGQCGPATRVFLNGAWTQAQLLWRSEQDQFFLFAGETPQRTHSVSRRALERLRGAELLGPLHVHSLIQRAVDSMLRNLARPA